MSAEDTHQMPVEESKDKDSSITSNPIKIDPNLLFADLEKGIEFFKSEIAKCTGKLELIMTILNGRNQGIYNEKTESNFPATETHKDEEKIIDEIVSEIANKASRDIHENESI